MRNFLKIAENLDVLPVLSGLANKPGLWDENTLRTTHDGSAHAQASDIWLLYPEIRPLNVSAVVDDLDVIPYRGWYELPQVRPIIFDLMRRVEGVQLGRCVITRLPPGRSITPHIDAGAPAAYYHRYQVMLQCLPGVLFSCGDEVLAARTGDVFMFQNQAEHSVVNNSADDRLAMIVDIHTC